MSCRPPSRWPTTTCGCRSTPSSSPTARGRFSSTPAHPTPSTNPTIGLIYDALDEAGIDRSRATDVPITHEHEDHASGLIASDGSEAFTKLERVWIGNFLKLNAADVAQGAPD